MNNLKGGRLLGAQYNQQVCGRWCPYVWISSPPCMGIGEWGGGGGYKNM